MSERVITPASGTPVRRPGSARRTTTIDIRNRPDGRLVLAGRARDLWTASADAVADAPPPARAEVHVELAPDRTIETIDATPDGPGDTSLLAGAVVGRGFRARVVEALPAAAGTPLGLLLDDLPVASLISGYAAMREWARGPMDAPFRGGGGGDGGGDGGGGGAGRSSLTLMADLCAGWQSGGQLMSAVDAGAGVPLQDCPPATPLADPADPLGWPSIEPLQPGEMRRTRRIDALPGAPIEVDAMFRDSYGEPDGTEVVLHEYGLSATVDPETLVIGTIVAVPRVLPYSECPQAAASAGWLVGRRLDEVPDVVRADFVGPPTCTHLNDLLRSLAGLSALLRL